MKNITNLIILLLVVAILFTVSGCSTSNEKKQETTPSDKRVLEAIDVLEKHWDKEYTRMKVENKYLKIVNTKIVNIKDNVPIDGIKQREQFSNIDYIVEFELISNYFNTAPYYSNAGTYNCVIVYKDGTQDVSKNIFDLYRTNTYEEDFSPIIESIEELDGSYNRVVDFK